MTQNMHNDIRINFDAIAKKMHDAIETGMTKVSEDWKREALNTFSKHTYTNDIRNSIDVTVKKDNGKIGAHFIANHAGAATLHFGRGKDKAFPPMNIIQKWARRRLGLSQDESERAAFPIAYKIAKEGFFRTKAQAGSKYAEKGPEGDNYGLNFASGPLQAKGKSGGKWETFLAKELDKAK